MTDDTIYVDDDGIVWKDGEPEDGSVVTIQSYNDSASPRKLLRS